MIFPTSAIFQHNLSRTETGKEWHRYTRNKFKIWNNNSNGKFLHKCDTLLCEIMRWNIGEGWVGIFPAVSPLLVWNCSFYPPNVAARVWQLLMEWWRTEHQLPHPHCEKIQFTLRVRFFQDSSLHFQAKLNFFHFVIAINPQLHWRMEWFWDEMQTIIDECLFFRLLNI